MTVEEKIKTFRKNAGLSQEQLAENYVYQGKQSQNGKLTMVCLTSIICSSSLNCLMLAWTRYWSVLRML